MTGVLNGLPQSFQVNAK